MTTILKERIQTQGETSLDFLKKVSHSEDEYRLLSEMIELLKDENIQFSISSSAFHTIVFANFPELGNGTLRFVIHAPKNRYSLECYYDNDDENPKPYIYHIVSAKSLVKQTVIKRIKYVAENLDEIIRERRVLNANNH
ncbi:TPA: hypothetical protein QCO08_005535 [Bacillus anthracis]|nr:hypothetical protein [Bacillus anthracis]